MANLFLDDLDHFIKQQLRVKAYLRYVDDSVVLDDDKGRLWEVCAVIRERLAADRLLLHSRKAHISPTHDGLDLLGYLMFPNHRRLRNDNGHRFARRLRGFARAYAAGRVTFTLCPSQVCSTEGAATRGTRCNTLSRLCKNSNDGQKNDKM